MSSLLARVRPGWRSAIPSRRWRPLRGHRAQSSDRRELAAAVRLAIAVHPSFVQPPSRPSSGRRPGGLPTRDEIADYFARYASHFEIPVRLGTAVVALDRRGGGFPAELDDGTTIDARAVVVASGAFQIPTVPRIAAELSAAVTQLTPLTYRNPSSVPAGVVLVVGDGATGRQIAMELADSHRVVLATGKKRSLAPQRLLGRSIFWWFDHLGLLRATGESRLGRRLRARDTLPRRDLADRYLRLRGVDLVPRLTAFDHASATFSDGQRREVGSVVWAAGYRDDTTWLRMADAVDASGSVLETQGRSPVPGLFFIGRPWQMTQSSGLVTGVGADARTIVTQVVTSLGVSSERGAGVVRRSAPGWRSTGPPCRERGRRRHVRSPAASRGARTSGR